MDAVDALAIRPIATSEPYLRKLLGEARPVGEKATIALVASRDPAILTRARAIAMAWSDPALRGLAALAVSALASVGDIDPALAALRDPDPEIRLGLGLVGLRSAIRNAKPSGALREAIVTALRAAERYPEKEAAGGADPKNLNRLEAMRCLVDLGEMPTIDRDLEDLASGDPQRVSDALSVLTDREIADKRATPLLLQLLEKAPLSRKRGFLQALGRVRDPAAAPAMATYLTGPGDFTDGIWLYEYAALQLANLGDAGVAALADALAKTKDPERRRAIVEGLSHSSGARADAALRAIAEDTADDAETRAVAIRALPDIEGDAAAGFLKRLLASEPDPRIRKLLNFVLFDRF
jgi:HEAT repeat protein